MAERIKRFCFCGECEDVIEETAKTLRWFESDFCNSSCLNKFTGKNAINCLECEQNLANGQIHAIKSANVKAIPLDYAASSIDGQPILSVSSSSLFSTKYFCSINCLNVHKVKNIMCDYCMNPMVSQATNRSGTKENVFCSNECRVLMQMSYNNNELFVGICDYCTKKGNITQRCLVDDIEYMMCSLNCRFEFEIQHEINLGNFFSNFR